MHNVWRAEIKARMAENCYFFPIFNIFQAYKEVIVAGALQLKKLQRWSLKLIQASTGF